VISTVQKKYRRFMVFGLVFDLSGCGEAFGFQLRGVEFGAVLEAIS
jgi:hypothetical protein